MKKPATNKIQTGLIIFSMLNFVLLIVFGVFIYQLSTQSKKSVATDGLHTVMLATNHNAIKSAYECIVDKKPESCEAYRNAVRLYDLEVRDGYEKFLKK